MCLEICPYAEKKFFEEYKDKKFVKLIKYLMFCSRVEEITEIGAQWRKYIVTKVIIETPFTGHKITSGGWLRAKNPRKEPPTNYLGRPPEIQTRVDGGSIHCYLNENNITTHLKDPIDSDLVTTYYYRLNCWGLVKDVFHVGNKGDICLDKIYIPQKELDRCIKLDEERLTKKCLSSKDSI
jgi:hypothetical protein